MLYREFGLGCMMWVLGCGLWCDEWVLGFVGFGWDFGIGFGVGGDIGWLLSWGGVGLVMWWGEEFVLCEVVVMRVMLCSWFRKLLLKRELLEE